MKKRKYEKFEVKSQDKPNKITAFMHEEDNVLEVDVYNDSGNLEFRHFVNGDKDEYATLHCMYITIDSRGYQSGDWSLTKLSSVMGRSSIYYSTYRLYESCIADKTSINTIKKYAEKYVSIYSGNKDYLSPIWSLENNICWNNYDRKMYNKKVRIAEINAAVTPVVESEEFKSWVNNLFHKSYLFADCHSTKRGYRCRCSSCKSNYWSKEKPKHNSITTCRKCNKEVTVKTRVIDVIDRKNFIVYQKYGDGWVARHFKGIKQSGVNLVANANSKKAYEITNLTEKIRLFKIGGKLKIFYGALKNVMETEQRWWDTKNGVMFDHDFYICPIGLDEAPIDENMKYAMKYGAEHNINCNWNNWHHLKNSYIGLEYLLKGRFYNLLREMTTGITISMLNTEADNIADYLCISPQRVNRLREIDGNRYTLKALRYEQQTGSKISQKNLKWITASKLDLEDLCTEDTDLSLEKAINYIRKITENGSYNLRHTLDRYSDYLTMAYERGMDITDSIVCLNPRMHEYHDRYLEEKNRLADEKREIELSKKYKNIKKDFKQNKEIFYWQDKNYSVVVPGNVGDIMREGRLQHHCVAASDSYFDKMNKRESFILFLRKNEDIEKPYYTLEVKINNNDVDIIQKYGAYDRQPDKNTVNKVLNKWKKDVKARIRKKVG